MANVTNVDSFTLKTVIYYFQIIKHYKGETVRADEVKRGRISKTMVFPAGRGEGRVNSCSLLERWCIHIRGRGRGKGDIGVGKGENQKNNTEKEGKDRKIRER